KLYLVVTATANEPAPALSDGVIDLLAEANDTRMGEARILVPRNGAASQEGDVIPIRVTRGPDEFENVPELKEKGLKDIARQLRSRLETVQSGQRSLDLLTGLDAAGQLSPHSTIVLVSSGLQTEGLADFAGRGWDLDIDETVAELKEKGFIHDLSGRRVFFQGLGDVAGAQQALPAPSRTTVEDFWMAVCRASQASECAFLPPAPDRAAPADRTAGVKTVPVPVFDLAPVPVSAGTVDWSLDSDTLFTPDSAVLRPSALPGLHEAASQIIGRDASVTITGRTWKVGPAEGARALSVERANAVATALRDAGVPAAAITSVRGVGYDEPVQPAAGQAEDVANRSVTITVSTR
ncbi:OmpA family protein, partial [Dietzia maris]|uniref:OmpA family protein n=1 Tax=Dietzia maris TaxID=37915 RepID=UPI0034306D44